MDTPVLLPAKTEAFSTQIVVGNDELVIVSLYTPDGNPIGSGPVLPLQFQVMTGDFLSVGTVQYGRIYFSQNLQQLTLSQPGTYRIYRPDISEWNYDIGVSIDRRSTVPVETYFFDADQFTTDYTGLDSLDGGVFSVNQTDRFDGGSF